MSKDTVFCDICVDVDGVIHSYLSGWQGADVLPDPPVEGAIGALYGYLESGLSVSLFSARSAQAGGIEAIRKWLSKHDGAWRFANRIPAIVPMLIEQIAFPDHKPAAKVYVDDRGYRFEGVFPSADELRSLFTPWYGG